MKEKIERTPEMLGAEIFSLCIKRSYRIGELTKKIYGNNQAKNLVRVLQTIEVLLGYGVLTPKFTNNRLHFQVNEDIGGLNK
jgi:hypothetical protein